MPSPTIKEQFERLSALNESAKAIEALKIALRALEYYADARNWDENDWGVHTQIDYADVTTLATGGKRARNAIKRINRTLAPGRVCKALDSDPKNQTHSPERKR